MTAREPYPPVPAFVFPTPGVRTWQPPAQSYFPPCTGRTDCAAQRSCPVGLVTTIDGGPYGCDCPCHSAPEGTSR